MFQFVEPDTMNSAKIKVIGIGGAGGNAVNTMIACNLKGVDFIAANTDSQALGASTSPIKIQIGAEVTKGLGAGSDPDVGRKSAIETKDLLRESLERADMVYHRWPGWRYGYWWRTHSGRNRQRTGNPHRRRCYKTIPL